MDMNMSGDSDRLMKLDLVGIIILKQVVNDSITGDSVVLRAKTLDDHDLEMMDSASDSKFPLALATLFFVCLFI